jgi:hypothetical protein
MCTRFSIRDKNGKPLNGPNLSNRASQLGGNNKRKKENTARMENEFLQGFADKEKKVKDTKAAAEAKLVAKRKAREAARLLDIEFGFVTIEEPVVKPVVKEMTWGEYLCRGVA